MNPQIIDFTCSYTSTCNTVLKKDNEDEKSITDALAYSTGPVITLHRLHYQEQIMLA